MKLIILRFPHMSSLIIVYFLALFRIVMTFIHNPSEKKEVYITKNARHDIFEIPKAIFAMNRVLKYTYFTNISMSLIQYKL